MYRPLSGLTNLKELSLDDNRIRDFSSIAGLIPNLAHYSNANQYIPIPVAPHAPMPPLSPSVYNETQRTVLKSDGNVAVVQLPSAYDGQTSSIRTSLRWTPGDTIAADLGTTVITVKFLNGTEEEKQDVMKAVKDWEDAANVDFVFYSSSSSTPSDLRVKFFYEGSTNSSKAGLLHPPLLQIYGSNSFMKALQILQRLVHGFLLKMRRTI